MRSAWENFEQVFFGHPHAAWHGGVDVRVLDALSTDERLRAEEELLRRLPNGDWRVVRGLGYLKSTAAVGRLLEFYNQRMGPVAEVARALLDIEGDETYLDNLFYSMRWGDYYSPIILRTYIEECYEQSESPQRRADIRDHLMSAVQNEEYLVRYHAADALLTLFNVQPARISEHKHIFANITMPGRANATPSEADFARFARAADQLAALER